MYLKTVACRHERHTPADNIALWVKLGIRQLQETLRELFLTHLK